MGHMWEYVYEQGPNPRVVGVRVDGAPAQEFTYGPGGGLVHVSQKITLPGGGTKSINMMSVTYEKQNLISGLLAFIIYPFVPEVWGFTN